MNTGNKLSDRLNKKVNKLFITKRGSQAAVEDINSTVGLFYMIQAHFRPDFEMVEVGSFEGTSTLMFALFVKKVYSVDCYDYKVPETGRIPSHDRLFQRAEKTFLRRTAKVPNIIKIRKTSVEAAKDFEDESLDAVYIDAEHDEESVRTDIQTWLPKVKKGGYLSGHDWWLSHIEKLVRGLNREIQVYQDSSWIVKK